MFSTMDLSQWNRDRVRLDHWYVFHSQLTWKKEGSLILLALSFSFSFFFFIQSRRVPTNSVLSRDRSRKGTFTRPVVGDDGNGGVGIVGLLVSLPVHGHFGVLLSSKTRVAGLWCQESDRVISGGRLHMKGVSSESTTKDQLQQQQQHQLQRGPSEQARTRVNSRLIQDPTDPLIWKRGVCVNRSPPSLTPTHFWLDSSVS